MQRAKANHCRSCLYTAAVVLGRPSCGGRRAALHHGAFARWAAVRRTEVRRAALVAHSVCPSASRSSRARWRGPTYCGSPVVFAPGLGVGRPSFGGQRAWALSNLGACGGYLWLGLLAKGIKPSGTTAVAWQCGSYNPQPAASGLPNPALKRKRNGGLGLRASAKPFAPLRSA